MNCSLPKITYPTFKSLLLVRLNQAIYLQREVLLNKEPKNPADETFQVFQPELNGGWIELKQVCNTTAIVYVSPIALQLASCLHVRPLDLAREITDNFSNLGALSPNYQHLNEELMKFIGENINFKLLASGWIEFQLRAPGWAKWLQFGLDHPPQLSTDMPPRQSIAPEILACQYAHARCCSLLRLGQQEQLITLCDEPPNWRWLAPAPLPWLTAETLRFNHPAAWQLLGQITAALDQLFDRAPSAPPRWLAIATRLTQAWQTYDRACPMFGQTGPEAIATAQSRLGLVMLTQQSLHLLLEQRLGVVAPVEL